MKKGFLFFSTLFLLSLDACAPYSMYFVRNYSSSQVAVDVQSNGKAGFVSETVSNPPSEADIKKIKKIEGATRQNNTESAFALDIPPASALYLQGIGSEDELRQLILTMPNSFQQDTIRFDASGKAKFRKVGLFAPKFIIDIR